MFTTENTEGYSDRELRKLNEEWNEIVERENLETGTDAYYQRQKQFSDEVARR